MLSDTAPTTPFYKENPFWGAVGFFITFVLTGMAFAMGGYVTVGRVLLALAWPWAIMALWLTIKGVTKRRKWRVIGLTSSIVTVGIVGFMADWIVRSAPKPMTVQPTIESKKEPPTETTDHSSVKAQPESKPSVRRPKREAPEKVEQTAVPVNDPSVSLLREAEETNKSLRNWMNQTAEHLRKEDTACPSKWGALPPDKVQRNCSVESQQRYGWAMADYRQTYADKLLDLRRRMLARLPNEGIDFPEEYQSPGNLGGVNGVEYDFSRLTVLYKLKLREEGKINDPFSREEQDELYMRSIKTPKN